MTKKRLIPLIMLIAALGYTAHSSKIGAVMQSEAVRGLEEPLLSNSGTLGEANPKRPPSSVQSQPALDRPNSIAGNEADSRQRSTVPDKPKAVKGIYVPASKTNQTSLNRLLKLLDNTELNAMVIDIKTDTGQVTYDSQVPLANEIRSDDTTPIPNIRALVKQLKERHVYTIARVVAFKDPYLSGIRTDLAMKTNLGAVWHDRKGIAWVDPYKPEVQDYNIALAQEAVQLGFDEIQFDYVRFPENGRKVDREVSFDNPKRLSKAEVIRDFLKKAKTKLGSTPISADVFGLTPSSPDDMGIGQQWNMISPTIDYISPMIYPSHYSDGSLGVEHPDLQPYEIVRKAISDAKAKNNELVREHKSAATIRPWLQDFTAGWVKNHQVYGAMQVNEQIKAAKDQGVDQFLLWNPNCKYSYQE